METTVIGLGYWGHIGENGKENANYCNGFRIQGLGFRSGTILGVLMRAIYNHIIFLVQLLLRGGNTQG